LFVSTATRPSVRANRPLAHHPRDRFFRQRRAAKLDDQFIRGVGEIAPRVDKRAVQVERDQAA
jgi:hypothetical protein